MKYARWLPVDAGAVIGMTYFEGKVLIACVNGLYEIRQNEHGGYRVVKVLG